MKSSVLCNIWLARPMISYKICQFPWWRSCFKKNRKKFLKFCNTSKLNYFWKTFWLRDPTYHVRLNNLVVTIAVTTSLLQTWSCRNDFCYRQYFRLKYNVRAAVTTFGCEMFWCSNSSFLVCRCCQKQLKIIISIKNVIILTLKSVLK